MSSPSLEKDKAPKGTREPVLQAKGIVKRYGPVTAIANSDLDEAPFTFRILGNIVDILFSTGGYVNPAERAATYGELAFRQPHARGCGRAARRESFSSSGPPGRSPAPSRGAMFT